MRPLLLILVIVVTAGCWLSPERPVTSVLTSDERRMIDYFLRSGLMVAEPTNPNEDYIYRIPYSSFAQFCGMSPEWHALFDSYEFVRLTNEGVLQAQADFQRECRVRIVRGLGADRNKLIFADLGRPGPGRDGNARTISANGIEITFLVADPTVTPDELRRHIPSARSNDR